MREGSLNKGLLRAAVELAPAGMEIQIYTRLGDLPPYNDDVFQKGDPEPVADLKGQVGDEERVNGVQAAQVAVGPRIGGDPLLHLRHGH